MITDRKKQNAVMAIIAISVIMFTIDYSMVNLALPAIAFMRSPIAANFEMPAAGGISFFAVAGTA